MAFNLLVNKAGVKPGERVLVMGATGALGSSCVQVAKMLGAKVIAGAGTDERVELAESYGADLGVNYRTRDLAKKSCSSRITKAWTSSARISPTRRYGRRRSPASLSMGGWSQPALMAAAL